MGWKLVWWVAAAGTHCGGVGTARRRGSGVHAAIGAAEAAATGLAATAVPGGGAARRGFARSAAGAWN